MAKKKKSLEKRKIHRISIKKEPIWLKMNIIGKYEGVKYRFTYSEHCIEDVDEVVKKFQFSWPGRIPVDKDFAEKGIKAMFTKQLSDGSISYKVINDNIDADTSKEEEDNMVNELNIPYDGPL